MTGWRPTPDQQRIAKWAAFSVGYSVPYIGQDDLQQEALLALWRANDGGSRVADSTVARSACLSFLQRSIGHTGSAKRLGSRATTSAPVDDSVPNPLARVNWETPERILQAKQSLAGFCGMRDLHSAVLADFIDGDLSRLEIAARHGVTAAQVHKISDLARHVIACGVPIRHSVGRPRAGDTTPRKRVRKSRYKPKGGRSVTDSSASPVPSALF